MTVARRVLEIKVIGQGKRSKVSVRKDGNAVGLSSIDGSFFLVKGRCQLLLKLDLTGVRLTIKNAHFSGHSCRIA